MDKDKNYYMNEGIGESGVGEVRNPAMQNEDSFVSPFRQYKPLEHRAPKLNVGSHFETDSKYDKEFGQVGGFADKAMDVTDRRDMLQTGAEKMGNAIANAGVIAATTFVGNFLGTANGLVSALVNWDISKLHDNATNRAFADLQEWAQEKMPVYMGTQYQQKNIFQKMLTSNFWASFVQNSGFMIGTAASMATMGGLLASIPKWAGMTIGAVVSSMNEASVESIQAAREDIESNYSAAVGEYNRMYRKTVSDQERNELSRMFDETEDIILADAEKASNIVFGLNMAILPLSTAIQGAKIFKRGFSSAKKASREAIEGMAKDATPEAVRKASKAARKQAMRKAEMDYYRQQMKPASHVYRKKDGTYGTWNKWAYRGIGAAKTIGKGFTEGGEEVAQGIFSGLSDEWSALDRFNDSMFNPDQKLKVDGFIEAMAASTASAFKDPQTAEEFMSGFLMGVLKMPGFSRNSSGKLRFKYKENPFTELIQANRQYNRDRSIADKVNQRLADGKFKDYYQGVIRHNVLEDRKAQAVSDNDSKSFHDAESDQMISDAIMFYEAGDLNRLKEIINEASSISDEDLQKMIDEQVKNKNDAFVRDGNPISLQEARDLIEKKRDEIISSLDKFVKHKEEIDSIRPDMNDDAKRDAVYLLYSMDDRTSRMDEIGKKIASKFRNAGDNAKARELKEKYGIDLSELGRSEAMWDLFRKINDEKTSDEVEKAFNDAVNDIVINNLERKDIADSFRDYMTLAMERAFMNLQLKSILANPESSMRAAENRQEAAVQEQEERKDAGFEEKWGKAGSLQELIKAVTDDIYAAGNTLSNNEASTILKRMARNGNKLAEDFVKIRAFKYNILRNTKDIDTDKRIVINKIVNQIVGKAESFNDVINFNFNSLIGNIENLSSEEQAEIVDLLKRLVEKMKSDDTFNNLFSEPAGNPAQGKQPIPASAVPAGNASETSNIPPANPTDKGKQPQQQSQQEKAGNANDLTSSFEEVKERNNQANSMGDNRNNASSGKRKWWMPAIPKFHIEGSRNNDFKPFKDVVKEKQNLDFSYIYNYLDSKGAFDYIDNGNLKVGDKVNFFIDIDFEREMANKYDWYREYAPTIFISHGEQVIGSLTANDNVIERHEGLREFTDNLRQGFRTGNFDGKSGRLYIKHPTTNKLISSHITKIIPGKTPVSNNEINLNQIVPRDSSGKRSEIILSIKNDEDGFNTNNKLSNDKIIGNDTPNGLYVMIPNGAGTYIPMAIRVRRLSKNDWDPLNPNNSSTPMARKLVSILNEIIEAGRKGIVKVDKVMELRDKLSNILFLDSRNLSENLFLSFGVKLNDGTYVPAIKINSRENAPAGKRRVDKTIYFTKHTGKRIASIGEQDTSEETNEPVQKSDQQILMELLDALMDFGLYFNVDKDKINKGSYNEDLLESNVLTSNISVFANQGAWFTINPIVNLEESAGETMPYREVAKPAPGERKPAPKEDSSYGMDTNDFTIGGFIYKVSADNKTIFDSKGNDITNNKNLDKQTKTLLFQLNYAKMNNLVNYSGIVFPGGRRRAININENRYATQEEVTKARALKAKADRKAKKENKKDANTENRDEVKKPDNEKESDKSAASEENEAFSAILNSSMKGKPDFMDNGTTQLRNDNARRRGKPMSGISNNGSNDEFKSYDMSSEDEPAFRRKGIDRRLLSEEEKAWFEKRMPSSMTEKDKAIIFARTDYLIEDGIELYGEFKKGMIILSRKAAKGTLYHEAFHAVFRQYFTPEEQMRLYMAAQRQWKKDDTATLIELEELMADEFMNFMIGMETQAKKENKDLNELMDDLGLYVDNFEHIEPVLMEAFFSIASGSFQQDSFRRRYMKGWNLNANEIYLTKEMQEIWERLPKDANGEVKATNLPPYVRVYVRTKTFKDWFGDWENHPEKSSKLLDENGEPIMVWHSVKPFNNQKFNIFNLKKSMFRSNNLNDSLFFSDNVIMSASYAFDPEYYMKFRGQEGDPFAENGIYEMLDLSVLEDEVSYADETEFEFLSGLRNSLYNIYSHLNGKAVNEESLQKDLEAVKGTEYYSDEDLSDVEKVAELYELVAMEAAKREFVMSAWNFIRDLGEGVKPVFLDMRNPKIIDAKGSLFNDIHTDIPQEDIDVLCEEGGFERGVTGGISTDAIYEYYTLDNEYDGVWIKNVVDYGSLFGGMKMNPHDDFILPSRRKDAVKSSKNIGTFSLNAKGDMRFRMRDSFDSFTKEEQEMLVAKGWSRDTWNNLTQKQKDMALHCAGIM